MTELIKAISSVTADQGLAAAAGVVALALVIAGYLAGQRREKRMLDAIIGERHDDAAPNLRTIEGKIDEAAGVAKKAEAKADEAVARVAAVERDVAGLKAGHPLHVVGDTQ